MANGKSVSQAINTANSYIYTPGFGVKNIKYYGNGSVRITSTSRAATLNLYDSPILKVDNINLYSKKLLT